MGARVFVCNTSHTYIDVPVHTLTVSSHVVNALNTIAAFVLYLEFCKRGMLKTLLSCVTSAVMYQRLAYFILGCSATI